MCFNKGFHNKRYTWLFGLFEGVVPIKLKPGMIKLCHGVVWSWKPFLKEAVMVMNLSSAIVEGAINLVSYSIINR